MAQPSDKGITESKAKPQKVENITAKAPTQAFE